MPKRTTRQNIIDRLESSVKDLDKIANKLYYVIEIYGEDYPDKRIKLNMLMRALADIQEAIKRFRYNEA